MTSIQSSLPPTRNIFPENLVQACFQNVYTTYTPKKELIAKISKGLEDNITTTVAMVTTEALNATNITAEPEMIRVYKYKNGMNVLGKT